MNEMVLEHHGIKGQKWGVRRFQNADGSLTNAGKKRYDYKESDRYKNASEKGKKQQTGIYRRDRIMYGKKAANRIAYNVNEQHMSRKEAYKQEDARKARKAAAVAGALRIGVPLVMAAASVGKVWYNKQKLLLELNNAAVNAYAMGNNIPRDTKVGVGFGINQIKKGKEVCDLMMGKKK